MSWKKELDQGHMDDGEGRASLLKEKALLRLELDRNLENFSS